MLVFYAQDVNVDYADVDGELVAVLSDVNGNPVAGADVFVVLNNVEYSLVTGSDGQVSVSTSDLVSGFHTASITYGGDDNYNPAVTTVNVVVNKLGSSIYAPDITVSYGDVGGELIAVLSDVNGNPIVGAEVFIILGNVEYPLITDSDGLVSAPTSDLIPGAYAANITYDGDDNHNPSNSVANIVVNKLGSSIYAPDITVSYGDVGGELIAVLSDVNGNPIVGADVFVVLGNVEYSLVTGSDGQVSVSTSDLVSGFHTASITYGGDDNYNPSSANAKVTVKTNVDISASYNVDAMEIVATLNNAATGMAVGGADVQVNLNGETTIVKSNSKGQVKVSVADLPFGIYTITFSYAGNTKYNPANTTIDINTKINIIISAVYDTNNNELKATLTNNATGNPVSGANVQVNLNGATITVKTDSKGQIKVSTVDLPLGDYTAVISYKGNSKYNSASTFIVFNINKFNTYFVVSDAFVEYGSDVELSATLINADTGESINGANLVFVVNDVSYTVHTNSNGVAKLTISGLAPNTYSSTVSYGGNSKYNPASEMFNVVVNKISTRVSLYYDDSTNELVAILINTETGKGISGANVVFNLDGNKVSVKTDKQGQARFSIGDVDPNNFNAGVSYGGNSKYLKSTSSIKIIENKIPTVISNVYDEESGEVVANLINKETGKPISGANVVFNLNGVKTAVKTNKQGQAIFSIANLMPGVYSVGSSYGGNSKYAGSTTAISIVKL